MVFCFFFLFAFSAPAFDWRATAERLGEAKPRGLARTQIDQLPSYRFSGEVEDGGQTTCVICMCEFETRQTLRVLPCSHEYHAKCIDKWLKVSAAVPSVRLLTRPSLPGEPVQRSRTPPSGAPLGRPDTSIHPLSSVTRSLIDPSPLTHSHTHTVSCVRVSVCTAT